MRSWLQHHCNTLHVYCRLYRVFGRRRARAIAIWWSRTNTYRALYQSNNVCPQ